MFRFLFLINLLVVSSHAVANDRVLLVLGDSLSAGYGIDIENGWVSLLQQRLTRKGYSYEVINSSISGDTTHGARTRLARELEIRVPEVAIIELGGNDGLRGLTTEEMRDNLGHIIDMLSAAGSKILLIPMQLPPNYGPVYNSRFMQVYLDIATEKKVSLGRFILQDIADNPELMQNDGIHPLESAQLQMLENIWPELENLLSESMVSNP